MTDIMTETITRWDESPAAELARAMQGDRPAAAAAAYDRPLQGRTEAEQRELRRQWERQMDAADQAGPGYAGLLGEPVSGRLNPWRDRQQHLIEFAEEIRQRGNWLGTGQLCPECQMESSGHPQIHPADHMCHREHLLIQRALASRAKLQRAELTGAIQRGITHPAPDAGYQAMQAQHDRSMLNAIAERLHPRGPSEIPG